MIPFSAVFATRPLLMLHGYMGTRGDFSHVLPELTRCGPVISFDHRGHGEAREAAREGPLNLDVLADDAFRFLEERELERCDLLGHSMGGMVAIRLVLAHPERIASLILMNTSAESVEMGPPPDTSLSERVRRRVRAVFERDPAAKQAAELHADREIKTRFAELTRASHRAVHPRAVELLHRAISHAPSLVERLSSITCPTTVINGAYDRRFDHPSHELARRIPGAELIVLPNSSHYPHFEEKAAWLAAIVRHLERARQPNISAQAAGVIDAV